MSEDKKEEELSFEDALKKLEQTVMKMEHGELSLDENIKCFEKPQKTRRLCVRAVFLARNFGKRANRFFRHLGRAADDRADRRV